jgi:hypothetical protein
MVPLEAELPQTMQRLSDLTIDAPSPQGSDEIHRRRFGGTREYGKQEETLAYLRTGDRAIFSKDGDLSQSEKQTKAMW